MARRYDNATIIVALEGDHTFRFDVQDWDTDDKPLGDEAACEMARGLVADDQVSLHGLLDGQPCTTIIDPTRVVAVAIQATGRGA